MNPLIDLPLWELQSEAAVDLTKIDAVESVSKEVRRNLGIEVTRLRMGNVEWLVRGDYQKWRDIVRKARGQRP